MTFIGGDDSLVAWIIYCYGGIFIFLIAKEESVKIFKRVKAITRNLPNLVASLGKRET